jgi:hypothetical protein
MTRLTFLRFFAMASVLVAVVIGCSGGGGGPVAPVDQQSPDRVIGIALGDIVQSGNELTAEVRFTGAVDMHALSFRVGFDPAGLKPVEVTWSDAVTVEDSTFQLLDRDGFVPLAMATFGGFGSLNGDGSLCTVRFTILDATKSAPWIIPDPAYLVARDSAGQPLSLVAGGGPR